MRRPAVCLGGVFSIILAATGAPCEGSEPMVGNTPALNLTLPFKGPGQLALIVSRGPTGRPQDRMVVIGTRESTQVLPLSEPSVARWRSPREIIVEQSGPDRSQKILRVDRVGQILETITDGFFVAPEPAPDGGRITVVHAIYDDIFKGLEVFEIRDLAEGFRLLRAFPRDELHTHGLAAWNPDGTQLAVSIESLEGTRIQKRLAVVSPETGSVRRLYESPEHRKRDERGVVLMFWHPSGIYAWSARGVLRCDPDGAGCTAVYDPGETRHVIGGTLFGTDEALLLVKDVQADFLEHRAKEIHRLDLTTGKGEFWVRLPDDVFVSDIDWIGDSDPKESDPSAPS